MQPWRRFNTYICDAMAVAADRVSRSSGMKAYADTRRRMWNSYIHAHIYIHTYKRQREMYTIICIYIHTYINYINIVIWYMNTCGTSFCLMGRCLCDRAAMLWPLRILNTAPWAAWTQSPKQNPKTQTTSPLASYIPLFDNHALDLADGDCQTVGCC